MPWVLGLDLGQASDFTGLAGDELSRIPPGGEHAGKWLHEIRLLDRYELGTPYPQMCAAVKATVERGSKPSLGIRGPLVGARMAVDFTGVGRPVVDILRAAKLPVRLRPILITAGHKVTTEPEDENVYHVPKKELVSTLQVLLQQQRLKVASSLGLARVLVKELQNFKVKITAAANETFGAWRDGQHDDLVLAVALAAWLGENTGGGDVGGIGLPAVGGKGNEARSVMDELPQGVFEE